MYLLKLFTIFLLFSNILLANDYLDSLTTTKVKKLIQKEEKIALAYKEYLLTKGEKPASISDLKNAENDKLLPNNFNANNYFGNSIKFSEEAFTLISFDKNSSKRLKSNIYDYYFSNKYRKYTKTPKIIEELVTIGDGSEEKQIIINVEINLSEKERLIYDLQNQGKIKEVKDDCKEWNEPEDAYCLDENHVLHRYAPKFGTDEPIEHKASYNKILLIDEEVDLFVDPITKKNTTDEYKDIVKDFMYVGMLVLHENGDKADEYVAIDLDTVIETNKVNIDYPDLIQLSNTSGAMLINGDIYSWGNNDSKVTGINLGSDVVITTPVRLKTKVYDDDSEDSVDTSTFYGENYFSSPLRPKFKELFSSVKSGTCGITKEGALYCGGTSASDYSFGKYFNDIDTEQNGEMLYRSTFFDGITNQAKKIFANDTLWTILGEDGLIYSWGYDIDNGFSGNGSLTYNNASTENDPTKILNTKFSDITSTTKLGHRKIAALSKDIYIWGIDSQSGINTCSVIWDGINYDLCSPEKINSDNSTMTEDGDLSFKTIRGGVDAFIAKGTDKYFYKITHHKNEKIQVSKVNDLIIANPNYGEDEESLGSIIDVDFSRTIDELSTPSVSTGIVWINDKNELKGDYYPSTSNQTTFKDAIENIQWKKIKVINENNSMCGINTDNQMYCWGNIYSSVDGVKTYILPIFNTNLNDLTSSDLAKESGTTSSFILNYPTYIGGFNYDFIFK